MGQNSSIEWTHHTFNPWIGCTKVSAGCANCYAEALMDKRWGKVKWGPNGTRNRTSDSNWREPFKWDKAAAKEGERHRVFCASLADVFEDRPELVPWRRDLFDMVCRTPHLDWLLLTKRPENALRMMVEAGLYAAENPNLPCPQPNLWIGTSVEDQAAADARIPHLLRIPAAVRFLSCEPLLGPVDLDGIQRDRWTRYSVLHGCGTTTRGVVGQSIPNVFGKRVDWVIVGGESGHGARPMHPEWPRLLRDQCLVAGVPFHFKQWGEWAPQTDPSQYAGKVKGGYVGHDGKWKDWNQGGESPFVLSLGKKATGRLLDGKTWDEFPLSPTGAGVS